MSTLYSLRVLPHFLHGAWQDVTDTLDVDKLPSISVAAERTDLPLTASASDLSLTVSNDGRWDRIFDVSRIIGLLPPTEGETILAPVAHYGKILFCRKKTYLSKWAVAFFGFVDPISVKFNRDARTVTFTAYSVSKLLELGNAERVNRFSDRDPTKGARPFLVYGYLTHPVSPPGSPTPNITDDRWWKVTGLAPNAVYIGDQFKPVHLVPWAPDVPTVTYEDTTFTVSAVSPVDADVYFQTKEASGLILGSGTLSSAIMEYVNPWYHSRKWEDLVVDLIAEVNAALAQLGASDVVTVETANLPLLPAGRTIFAEPINMSDVFPPISGVAYQQNSGTKYLLYSRQSQLFGKSDILGVKDLPGEPVAIPLFNPPGVTEPNFGPDFGKPERLLSPTPIIGTVSLITETIANFDFGFCGQDIHQFNATGVVTAGPIENNPYFDSIHWTRTPSSYLLSGEPKRFYRIYARARWAPATKDVPGHFRKGIEIRELTTSDGGTTWTLASLGQNLANYPEDTDAAPLVGRWAARPDFKLFKLVGSNRLYCWTDPIKNECYVLADTSEARTASTFFPPPPSFIPKESVGSPIGSSGFVTEGAGSATAWFFADRRDTLGVDLWYWNGSAMLQATVADTSGKGFPNLQGGDFINAITDVLNNRRLLYVMVGKSLFVIAYTWDFETGTFTSTDWQIVELDAANYDQAAELQAGASGELWATTGALAWLTGPVQQANPGEPDYTAASSSAIVATTNAIDIVSNAAVNIVDIADFDGLSVGAALSEMILVRGYQMLAEADQDLINDPAAYDPIPVVRFRQRLVPFPTVLDLSKVTEQIESGTWLENYSSVQVQNSRRPLVALEPVGSDSRLTTLEGVNFTISVPRNAKSSGLSIDNRYIATKSFARLLANLYAQEFAIPRPGATLVVVDPYALGMGKVLKPCDWIKYLLQPPDGVNPAAYQTGRVLSIDYALDHGLTTLKVA